jgi:DNA repair exonuclease SbcCD ATPase subunit
MTAKKPPKTVSGMSVLNDIRGLLSTPPRPALPTEAAPPAESGLPAWQAERARFAAQIKRFEELVQKQQGALDRLEAEKNEMDARLKAHQSVADRPPPPSDGSTAGVQREMADLEARKAELTAAADAVEELLRFKVKDLARRIAWVFQEAGDNSAGRDFRRISDQLEAAENFGEFVRALVRGGDVGDN